MTKLARRVTPLLIFASLLPPAAADARRPGEPVIRGGSLTKGPVLAGRRAAWSQDNGEDTEIVRTGARGIRARTVYREQAISLEDLAASSSRLAFASVFTGGAPQGPLSVGVLAGPLSGPFAARGGSCPGPRVALAGGRLLGLDKPSRCGGSGPDVAVVEDATGAVQRVPLGVRAADPVAIAGRLFAFVDATNRAVTVFDLSERRVVLRVPTSVDPAPGLDLQPDGKLVVSRRLGRGRFAIDWHSLAEPSAHTISAAGAAAAVRIARDRIAFLRRGRVLELVYARLSGRRNRVASFRRRGRGATALVGSFDFDGVRMAWGVRRRGRGNHPEKIRLARTRR